MDRQFFKPTYMPSISYKEIFVITNDIIYYEENIPMFLKFQSRIMDFLEEQKGKCNTDLLESLWNETKEKLENSFKKLNDKYLLFTIVSKNPLLPEFIDITLEHFTYMKKNFSNDVTVILDWLYELPLTIESTLAKIYEKDHFVVTSEKYEVVEEEVYGAIHLHSSHINGFFAA